MAKPRTDSITDKTSFTVASLFDSLKYCLFGNNMTDLNAQDEYAKMIEYYLK